MADEAPATEMPGEVPAIDPEQFATLIGNATDEQLNEGLAMNRDLILGEIFRRMPERFDPTRAANVDAVIEWRISDRPGGGHDTFQIVIRGGACTLAEGANEEPRVIYEIRPLDFLRLISGNASGPQLFLVGRLKIRGDLFLAARVQSWFTIPRAQRTDPAPTQ
ncbi:MAG TPA: SCP2 sterol-binding domain-containing protein [Solirubrobacteraceae bacterium]|jgi:putative sterol carrier protein|nr:SCP2 sterol-binding domain-containing protein [Solirubrobacteraceae bacterium]